MVNEILSAVRPLPGVDLVAIVIFRRGSRCRRWWWWRGPEALEGVERPLLPVLVHHDDLEVAEDAVPCALQGPAEPALLRAGAATASGLEHEVLLLAQLGQVRDVGVSGAVRLPPRQREFPPRLALDANDLEHAADHRRPVLERAEHLRFGVPTAAARVLASGGVRHRCAAVGLGTSDELRGASGDDRMVVFATARQLLHRDRDGWQARLGSLVFSNTLWDLSSVTGDDKEEVP